MFEYKTRTESINGIKFIEPDILMFDYEYSGDSHVLCNLNYEKPGFGFVISAINENIPDIAKSQNVYLAKIGAGNSYSIYHKEQETMSLLQEGYITITDASVSGEIQIGFSIKDGYVLELSVISGDKKNGDYLEESLMRYTIPTQVTNYKIGIYSNKGNTLHNAVIETEAPGNWISNVYNGNGGRINWIKNGFTIEECEYDCEVESENIILKKGTYYLSFDTTNPDIKYYVYPTTRKSNAEKRQMTEIMATKIDEDKNILTYEDGKFRVDKDGNYSIKFKGKWGKVTNIAVKKYKNDNFVETGYNENIREASWITVDLNKIKKVDIDCTINKIPESGNYSLLTLGKKTIKVEDLNTILGIPHHFTVHADSGTVEVDKRKYPFFTGILAKELILFRNVDAVIRRFIITYISGEEVNVLVQKTLKTTVDGDVKTPIIVTNKINDPYDLSSSFREIVTEKKQIDLFNKWAPILLSKNMCLNNSRVRIVGINEGIKINSKAEAIEDIASQYELISHNDYEIDYRYNQISIDNKIRDKYKYVAIEYYQCDDFVYGYTNYERLMYRTDEVMIITKPVCNKPGSMIVYGALKGSIVKTELAYRVPSEKMMNAIDYFVDKYELIPAKNFEITDSSRIIIDKDIIEKYDYIIIDFLKNDSYAINKSDGLYHVDIATTSEDTKIVYDYDEHNVGNRYRNININFPTLERGDFIVLEKGSKIQ